MTIKQKLKELEKSNEKIMNEIEDILDSNTIEYSINDDSTEIIVESEEDIKKLIKDNISLSKEDFSLLIKIASVNKKYFIRLKRD